MEKPITLRELITILEQLSRNGRNDNMPVMMHSEYMGQDCYGQDECEYVHNAFINMFNDCGTIDESTESYEFIEIY